MDKKEYQHQYYLKNKEKVLKRTHKYYCANKEKYKKWSKDHYERNKEEIIARHKKYNRDNMNKIRLWEKSYHKTPAGYYRHLKKKANARGKEFIVTKQEFIDWLENQKFECCYCGIELIYDMEKETSPSVDRKENNKGYTLANICLCCTMCNKVKNKFFSFEEMKLIGKTIHKIILNRK